MKTNIEEQIKKLEDALGIVNIETASEGTAKAILNERAGTFVFIDSEALDEVLTSLLKQQEQEIRSFVVRKDGWFNALKMEIEERKLLEEFARWYNVKYGYEPIKGRSKDIRQFLKERK